MATKGGLRVDLTKFNLMLGELASATGRSKAQVVDSEVTAILNKTIEKVPPASVSKIREYYDQREWVTFQGTKYNLKTKRYPAYLWRDIQDFLFKQKNDRIARRGLTKQGWYVLGKQLGLAVVAPDYAVAATVRGRVQKQEVTGTRQASGKNVNKYVIRLINGSPLNRWTGGRAALMSAIGGRMNFFATNLKKGVFDDASAIAKKYPGLNVRSGA